MAAPLSPRSLNTLRNIQIETDSNPWLKIHIVTSQTASAITERKFEKSLTIGQLKGKLELLTGYSSGSMELIIEDKKGNKIGEIKSSENDKMLGSFQIDDGMTIRVNDPDAVDWNNLDKVEKVEMDDEVYDSFKPTSVKPTVREYKRIHKLGKFNPEFQKKAQSDFDENEQMEKEARERIKKGNRCEVKMANGVKHRGEVKFLGETEFKKDLLWIGVQLDEPYGKNNGSVAGKEYFTCPASYGVFVRPGNVEVGDYPEQDELDFSDDEI
jgi:tubulin-folding cofactor B